MKRIIFVFLLIFFVLGCNDDPTNKPDSCGENSSMVSNSCVCDAGYHAEDDSCKENNKLVKCNDVTPDNATVILKDVEIIWQNGNWTNAKKCDWNCNDSFHTEDEETCTPNSKTVSCTDKHPENSTVEIIDVDITWSDNTNSWSEIPECVWNCNTDFHKEDSLCVSNTKQVPCKDVALENGVSKIIDVDITWDSNTNSWSEPTNCDWDCKGGFHKATDGTCTEDTTCEVNTCSGHGVCDDTSGRPVCTCNAGYAEPNCNGCTVGFQDNDSNNTCLPTCEKAVADGLVCTTNSSCIDTAGIAICECNNTFHMEGNNCVSDTKEVDCNNTNTPENAIYDDAKVTITWNGTEWSVATDCTWSCKTGYDQTGTTCTDKCVNMDCDDGNSCTSDSCLAGVCKNENLPDSTSCNDNSACTEQDICTAGICGGTELNCDDNKESTLDSCEPATGCKHTIRVGEACDDSSACTENDKYDPDGICVGTTINCDDGDANTTDSCNPATGCMHNEISCNDNDACTTDTLENGECSHTALDCNDNKESTTDSCDPAIGCVNTIRVGEACDDGNACSENDKYDAQGICVGTELNCNDDNPNTVDSCNTNTGCVNTEIVCNDNNACTTDAPVNGECVFTPIVCNDDNEGTIDSCDPQNGQCVYEVRTGTCDDGLYCTIDDTYNAQGICVGGSVRNCNDDNEGTIDSCDEDQNKCVNTFKTGACDDGLFCTINDTYNAQGVCEGIANSCDDNDDTTIDSCDEVNDECVNTVRTGACDDGLFCTINDTYNAQGICEGVANSCDDNDEGTIDSCDEVNDECVNTVRTGDCDDGLFCTINDTYNAQGVCEGVTNSCDDNDDTTIDSCDEVNNECINTVRTGDCDDDNPCTNGDHYVDGICVGSAKDCNDDNSCTTDSCDSQTGECIYTNVAVDTPCDDGDLCTIDACNDSGVCVGTSINCNNGTCNAVDGTCTCEDGYEGDNCETDIDDCASNPCKNGATCTDGVDTFTCTCTEFWTGETCETDIDECAGNTHNCDTYATCSNTQGGFECTCKNGYEGNGVDCEPVIVINETYAGAGDGWIELYNKGTKPVDLSDWVITTGDDASDTTIAANSTINVGEYFIVSSLSIDQSLDIIKLYDDNFTDTLDFVEFLDLTSPDYSRIPNGTGNFADVTIATPNKVNTDASALVIGWCNTQYPAGYTKLKNVAETIYGQVYIENVTGAQNTPLVASDIVKSKVCWVNAGVESCVNADFNTAHNDDTNGNANGVADDNNDEYKADLSIPIIGVFDYYYQFSGDIGYTWTRCTDPATDYQATITDPVEICDDGIDNDGDSDIDCDDSDCSADPACASGGLFISEYVEGSSNNKAVELYNSTSSDIDLSKYKLWKISNGGNWPEAELSLTGILAANTTYVIVNNSASTELKDKADLLTTSQVMGYNGDDAIGLVEDKNNDSTWSTDELIDSIGEEGADPGNGWNVDGTNNATKDHTIRRKTTVTVGNTDWSASSASEWEVLPKDTYDNIGIR